MDIKINSFRNIKPINIGISDADGKLPLYCNDTGNRGGDSFSEVASDRNKQLVLAVKPLLSILDQEHVKKIDILKLDIEGFEKQVMQKFFDDAPISLSPKFICTEICHTAEVIDLIMGAGYRIVLSARENCILAR